MIKEELKVMIGKRIKLFRKAMKLSQEKFADKMGYDSGSSMISQIENGGATMSMEQAVKAARILNVHPAVLLTDKNYSDDDLRALNNFLLILEDHKNPNRDAIKTLIKASIK